MLRSEPGEQGSNHSGLTNIESEFAQSDSREHIRGELQQLEVSGKACDAHELDTHLRNLTVGAGAATSTPDNRTFASEAERRGPPAQASCHHARDLRRHVGTECRDFAGLRLHETKDIGGIEGPEASLENVRELESRRRHRSVPEERGPIEDSLGESTTRRSILRK
jgi:hypothetical protein